MPTPFWDNRPRLQPWEQTVYAAFWDLLPDRQITPGGVGFIPFTVVEQWARRFGPERDDTFRDFFDHIRALDVRYHELMSKEGQSGERGHQPD